MTDTINLYSMEQTDAKFAQTADLATVATTGSYDDLTDKPTIPAAQVQADWGQADSDAVDFIKNKPTIPAAQVQADWSQADTDAVDYIKNKPTVPTITQQTGYWEITFRGKNMTIVKFYDKGQTEAIFDSILPDTSGATAGQILTLDANLMPIWS